MVVPTYERTVETEGWPTEQLPVLFEVLADHTATADDCYVGIWDGWGHPDPTTDDVGHVDPVPADSRVDPADSRFDPAAAARPGLAPVDGAPASSNVAKVVVPHREFWLLRGPLTSVGTAQNRLGPRRLDEEQPAFVWPADHGWCFAQDVDPHWAGIGGSTRLMEQLIADPRLDVVLADPTAQQPSYR